MTVTNTKLTNANTQLKKHLTGVDEASNGNFPLYFTSPSLVVDWLIFPNVSRRRLQVPETI